MKQEKPFVSIIIATYRAVECLPAAIESVISQQDVSHELIVIDGGSHDGTVQLLESYGDQLAAWTTGRDGGIYDAWNKGLALAHGEWIAFLGADDILLPDALACYQSFIAAHSRLDYVSSRIRLTQKNGCSRVIGRPWSWDTFKRYMNVAHVGSFHHSRLFRLHGSFDSRWRICGDYEFLLRVGPMLQAGFIDEVLVEMAAGGVSESSTRGIHETLQIKLHCSSVSTIRAWLDFVEAWTKWHLRRLPLRLSHGWRYILSLWQYGWRFG